MRRRTPVTGEGLCRYQRLRQRKDFVRCYRRGRKRHGSLASVHFHPNESRQVRLGITASRKVGKAVVRHRLKRRIREIFRRYKRRDSLGSTDVVVHLKPAASLADFAALSREIESLLGSLITSERRQ